ncbi:hypothetical protein GCM10009736_74960 [Actinomadura bangladeshensis]
MTPPGGSPQPFRPWAAEPAGHIGTRSREGSRARHRPSGRQSSRHLYPGGREESDVKFEADSLADVLVRLRRAQGQLGGLEKLFMSLA